MQFSLAAVAIFAGLASAQYTTNSTVTAVPNGTAAPTGGIVTASPSPSQIPVGGGASTLAIGLGSVFAAGMAVFVTV